MDVVALAQSGFGNAVATLGTACTAEHVQKLFRFTDSVVFSFDGDAAGRRAAGRALEASLPHATDTRTVRFLFLPPEHDPDSYVRELGAAGLRAVRRRGRAAVAPAGRGGRRGLRPGDRRRPGAHAGQRAAAVERPARRRAQAPAARRTRRAGAPRRDRARRLWELSVTERPTDSGAARDRSTRRPARVSRGRGQPARPGVVAAAAAAARCGAGSTAKRTICWPTRQRPTATSSACLERGLLEHGPQAPAAVLADLREHAKAAGGGDVHRANRRVPRTRGVVEPGQRTRHPARPAAPAGCGRRAEAAVRVGRPVARRTAARQGTRAGPTPV